MSAMYLDWNVADEEEPMNVRTRSRRIPLGPWGITLKMRADRAYAISRSAPYRFVAKPFLDAMVSPVELFVGKLGKRGGIDCRLVSWKTRALGREIWDWPWW